MKKLFLLLFGLLAVFAFVGCNGSDGSDISVDLDEYIASPTNLSINGTVLSWDAVDNADGYIVYANGEEEDKVSTTSFDFGSIAENGMIFQVRTRAPRGMQDSPLSAKVAYVANVAAEVATIESAMDDLGMSTPDGFADELVRKGMLGSEAEALATSIQDFADEMENVQGIDDFYTALNALLEDVDNIEAIVSAVVKTVMVDELENMIDQTYPSDPQIDAYQAIIDEIESDPDAIVMAITSTIEYFLSIEAMIDQNLIDTINSLVETGDIKDMSVSELVLVKEEMVNILRDTMPTQEEMTMVFQVYDLLLAMSGSYTEIDVTVENYEGRMAVQAMYELEAFINFLDSLDQTFFTDLIAAVEYRDVEEVMYKSYGPDLTDESIGEILILMIKQFAAFKADNQDLLDTISAGYIDEEKETIYNDIISSLEDVEGMSPYYVAMMQSIDFQVIIDLEASFGDAFDAVLNEFVDSDGEVIRQIVIANGFHYDWYDDIYTNDVTGEDYDNYYDYNYAQQLVSYEIAGEVVKMVDAAFNELSSTDYINLATIMVDLVVPSMFAMSYDTSTEMSPLVTVAEALISNSGADQFELIQNAVGYAVDEDVFGQLSQYETDVRDHYIAVYGADFYDNSNYWEDDYDMYAQIILFASIYDDFMTSGNRGLVDDIISEVAVSMADDDFQDISSLTDAQVQAMQNAADNFLDVLKDAFHDIQGYNPDNLSASDMQDIDDLLDDINTAFQAIGSSMYDY